MEGRFALKRAMRGWSKSYSYCYPQRHDFLSRIKEKEQGFQRLSLRFDATPSYSEFIGRFNSEQAHLFLNPVIDEL